MTWLVEFYGRFRYEMVVFGVVLVGLGGYKRLQQNGFLSTSPSVLFNCIFCKQKYPPPTKKTKNNLLNCSLQEEKLSLRSVNLPLQAAGVATTCGDAPCPRPRGSSAKQERVD